MTGVSQEPLEALNVISQKVFPKIATHVPRVCRDTEPLINPGPERRCESTARWRVLRVIREF